MLRHIALSSRFFPRKKGTAGTLLAGYYPALKRLGCHLGVVRYMLETEWSGRN
jgi:hypothetical protein